MIDAGSIAAMAPGDIAKTMIGLRDAATLQAKTIELQAMILNAQGSAFSAQQERSVLVERIRELEAEVARMKAWGTEKQRYELKRWGDAAFAYVLKEAEAGGEPMHAICPGCYQRGVKSILQSNGEMQVHKHAWNCSVCKTSVKASQQAMD